MNGAGVGKENCPSQDGGDENVVEDMRHFFIKIRNKLILLNNRRKGLITINYQDKIPHIILHEKYETFVKWLIRILIILGILLSFLTLPWQYSVITSIILVVIEIILEKIIFKYRTLFIQPIPRYRLNSWLAMVFLIPLQEGIQSKIGMLFDDEKTAQEIFTCLMAWNYFEEADPDNNIQITFVIENEEEYSTYIYPTYSRKSIILAKTYIERKKLENKEIKEHEQLVMTPIFCRTFGNPPNSSFRLFLSKYNEGAPFEFGVFARGNNFPEMVEGNPILLSYNASQGVYESESIKKNHLKIIHRSELTDEDLEYHHGRLIMELL